MFFTQVYTPPRTIVAHDYKRTQGDPSHFKWNGKGGPRLNQNKTIVAQRDAANRRIWTLLGMPGGDPDPAARRSACRRKSRKSIGKGGALGGRRWPL